MISLRTAGARRQAGSARFEFHFGIKCSRLRLLKFILSLLKLLLKLTNQDALSVLSGLADWWVSAESPLCYLCKAAPALNILSDGGRHDEEIEGDLDRRLLEVEVMIVGLYALCQCVPLYSVSGMRTQQ